MDLKHNNSDLSIIGKSFSQANKSTECIINNSTPDLINSEYSIPSGKGEFIVYRKRWLILILFTMYSATNAAYWSQYSIIQNIIARYYNVSNTWIEWSAMIYFIVYIPLLFPACWIMDKMGLRFVVVCGAAGTFAGAWIKMFSSYPHQFYIGFIGQTIIAISQVFVLSLPSRVAAVWFGPNEVSTACSIGVFGNELGVALGFVLPTLMVSNHDELALIGADLKFMFIVYASWTTILFFLVLIFFQNEPKTPPSAAQAASMVKTLNETSPFYNSIKRLLTNKNYVLLLLGYGINVSVFYAIGTLMNPIILKYYPDQNVDVGRIALLFSITGMIGSIIGGIVLDKTHRYKETCLFIHFMNIVSMLLFTFTLSMGLYVVYATTAMLGFFMAAYLSTGFEFAAELTYPEPETTSTGILNMIVQIFAIATTIIYSTLFTNYDDLAANGAVTIIIGIGFIFVIFIKSDLRRQAAQNLK